MRARALSQLIVAATLVLLSSPTSAAAHAFGARYDLPLPLWLYLTGAGAAVAFTFVLLTLFARTAPSIDGKFSRFIPALSPLLGNSALRTLVRLISVAIFTLILLTGFFGQQNPIHNLAPTLVWVIWWVGFTFFVALLGNAWPNVNPWSAVYDGISWLTCRWQAKDKVSANHTDPPLFGVWPSVLLLAVFVWLELVSKAGEMPRTLSCLILVYSVVTWGGMALYGRDRWLKSGEAFHQYFSVLGQFAPVGTKGSEVVLRPFGAGLMAKKPRHFSMTAFVILMLSTVTFDGFMETPAWSDLIQWISENRALRPFLIGVQSIGIDLLTAVKTAAFIIFPILFLGIFRAFCGASRTLADGTVTADQLSNTLVLSLVPIAIAYHISHYLSYLLLAGQLIIPLASDPFGWGWDLFGTASYSMDIGIINAATVWYVAISAIVLGHVIAVWVCHEMALTLYGNARQALLSQIPMLVLMVGYTMTSLWILSQPIVEP